MPLPEGRNTCLLIYLRHGTRMRVVAVLALVLILLGVRAGLSLHEGEEEAMAKILPLSRVNTSLPSVGLIVDVSQADAERISAALTALQSTQVKATWFIDATTVESCQAAVKEIASGGHELGIKGTDQKPLDKLPALEVKDRLQRSRQALAQLDIEPVPFLYPPSGRYSDVMVSVAFQEGIEAVKQAFDATRMRGKEEDAAAKLAGSLKSGDFLLVRVGRKGMEPAASYVAALQASLNRRGLSFLPLSVLVKGVK